MTDKLKNVPYRRFKKFENADAWEQRKLGDVAQITMGQSPNSVNYTNNPADYILVQGNADMQAGYVTPRVWTTQITKTADKGDIVLSVRAPVGDVGKTNYAVVLGRGVAGIKGNSFIFQQLGMKKSNGYWNRYSTGSTFESINSKDLKESVINIPSDEEQLELGNFFDNFDDLITLHQRKLDKLKNLKSAYLTEMFPAEGEREPKRRFSGFTDPWEQRKLGEIGKTFSGIGFPENEQGGTEGIPFFKVSDMNNNGNEHEMNSANNYVSNDQLKRKKWKVINNVPGVIFAKVGAAIMLNRKRLVRVPFLIDNNTMEYAFDDSWDTYFGQTLFETVNLPRYAHVGALPSYNGSDIETISVEVPDKNEQEHIGSFFKQLDHLITLHQQKLEKLQNLKQAYLNEMFV